MLSLQCVAKDADADAGLAIKRCQGIHVQEAEELTSSRTKKPRMPNRMLTAAAMIGIHGLGVPRKGEGFSAISI